MALYRQGRISGSVYTGRGQEAVAAARRARAGDGRRRRAAQPRAGRATSRAASPSRTCSATSSAAATGPTRGRDGNMHFGVPERGVFPLVSMLGDLVPGRRRRGARVQAARRAARRADLLRRRRVLGGDVHEGLNLAGVWRFPPSSSPSRTASRTRRRPSSRCATRTWPSGSRAATRSPATRVDGTDALASTAPCARAVERARAGEGPQAVEALTLRVDGHAAHDDAPLHGPRSCAGVRHERDPVERLAARLLADGLPADDDRGAARGCGRRGRRRAGRGRGGAGCPTRRRCSTASTRRRCAPAGAEPTCRRSSSTTSSVSRRHPRRPGRRSRASPGSSTGSPRRRARASATRSATSCGASATGGRRWCCSRTSTPCSPPTSTCAWRSPARLAARRRHRRQRRRGRRRRGRGRGARAELARPLAVVFTVGEEGLGNLRGALHACGELRPEMAIALEGHGLDDVCVDAVGSVRARLPCTARAATRGGIAAGRARCTRWSRC